MTRDNGFWKVCEALDSPLRIELLRYLMQVESTEFPCVSELAERFKLSEPAMSIHLKKLHTGGLVYSKRADRRIYYRAFATTREGKRVAQALRTFFARHPNAGRLRRLAAYVHALSHYRRHAIVRCLHRTPDLDLLGLSVRTEIPPQSAGRLLAELDRAHVFDRAGCVVPPRFEPERTLLALTLR